MCFKLQVERGSCALHTIKSWHHNLLKRHLAAASFERVVMVQVQTALSRGWFTWDLWSLTYVKKTHIHDSQCSGAQRRPVPPQCCVHWPPKQPEVLEKNQPFTTETDFFSNPVAFLVDS